MPDTDPIDRPELGDLDGEPVDAMTIKLTGGASFPRRLEESELVVLVITGNATPGISVKRIDGRLTRIHTVKVIQLAEPTAQLADEAAAFLQAITDAEDGTEHLPFDKDVAEDPDDDWEYKDPDPQPPEED